MNDETVFFVDHRFRVPVRVWRGRIVGVSCDPETLFMSQVGDPNNYDYAPPSEPDPDHVIQKPSESEAG